MPRKPRARCKTAKIDFPCGVEKPTTVRRVFCAEIECSEEKKKQSSEAIPPLLQRHCLNSNCTAIHFTRSGGLLKFASKLSVLRPCLSGDRARAEDLQHLGLREGRNRPDAGAYQSTHHRQRRPQETDTHNRRRVKPSHLLRPVRSIHRPCSRDVCERLRGSYSRL
jgi:hypothetical protein